MESVKEAEPVKVKVTWQSQSQRVIRVKYVCKIIIIIKVIYVCKIIQVKIIIIIINSIMKALNYVNWIC